MSCSRLRRRRVLEGATSEVALPFKIADSGRWIVSIVRDVHPNESLVREAYAAMAAGDGRTLAKMLTPDTTWVICGKGTLAGSYRGPDEIFGLWKGIAEQTDGGLQLELQDVLANDARAVAIVVARGERNGRVLDERQLAHFEFAADGKVQTARFIYEDPDAYDAFWTS